ncbi:MBL fold metallo-hydrolase [Virgibacillus alimentarius]|uniref:Glyoxylase-like metal-dependent hydrolase (Beta-lactamase superfamily II) n=1 Tax=Virgibacillus alimentarius TaxID=698769 RepID=A0ABS4S4M5_9BACI|nr:MULTISPECIES: MBL fold metallo-hydrolase [Virgibacillus]MBP2256442.1 glyoxylase-like metal-dependent hydrolase (beta-lactamase superfamily II) [Virgibacillus alimentarius]HLR66387.1 MBL fold metallo-hydrolase [Virgibacillus sp.]
MKILDKAIHQLTIPTPFAVGDVHMYLIKGDVLSLVDAGVKTKEAWETLQSQLKDLGYYPNDIEQIILTHHHPDHIGLIEQFPRAQHIIAHKNVDPWIIRNEQFFKHHEHFFKKFFNACGIPSHFDNVLKEMRKSLQYAGAGKVTKAINEGDLLPGHKDWKVIETKGHAQSHLSFFRKNDGTFIGGDHLLHHISSNPILEPPYAGETERTKPLLQYRDNLKKCLSLGIKTVLPGHGKSFSDVEALIPARLQSQEQRANKVHSLLRTEGILTPFQICQHLFPKHYVTQLDLTMSETIGQLDFLEQQNKVDQLVEDGVHFYRAK